MEKTLIIRHSLDSIGGDLEDEVVWEDFVKLEGMTLLL
jgi:hypothetical protein